MLDADGRAMQVFPDSATACGLDPAKGAIMRMWPFTRRAVSSDKLLIESIGQSVPLRDIDRVDVAVVVIEDLCWRIATESWSARRPPRWRHRARIAWRAEGEALQTKQDRVRGMAA